MNLYDRSDKSLLAGVFENFQNMCLKIYELDPGHCFVSGLTWQAALKKTKIKLELLTDTDMFLTLENGIRGGICHAFIDI